MIDEPWQREQRDRAWGVTWRELAAAAPLALLISDAGRIDALALVVMRLVLLGLDDLSVVDVRRNLAACEA